MPHTLTLPKGSYAVVTLCLVLQAFALCAVAARPDRSFWLSVLAFGIAGFLSDLVTGLFHFSFDYIWPPEFPIMGPIAVEFREHHEDPTLDPSALLVNFTKGSYGAIPLLVITWIVARTAKDTPLSFLVCATLMAGSLWVTAFHQIHSYAHMGSLLPPEEFNRAVAEISRLPLRQQKRKMAELFDTVGIPWVIRRLQRARLFLRPEIHWRHHVLFEEDFSSVNGWSDPLMNLFYRPVARRKKAAAQLEEQFREAR